MRSPPAAPSATPIRVQIAPAGRVEQFSLWRLGRTRSQRRHGPSVRAAYRLINSWTRGEVLIQITGTIALHEREMDERFVRASGPGGQNVNKVATAVELRFDVGVSSLPPDVKARLTVLAGSRMTTDGVLVIDSREQPHAGTEPGGCSGTSRCADSEGRHPAKKAQAHEAGPGREGAATGREETPSRCEGYAGPAPRQRRLV